MATRNSRFDDSASKFYQNITMKAHAGIGQPEGWARLIDRNLFMTEADRTANLGSGGDANSLAGDPKFLDPASGDYRVADDSPALKLGFKNFPMEPESIGPQLLSEVNLPLSPKR